MFGFILGLEAQTVSKLHVATITGVIKLNVFMWSSWCFKNQVWWAGSDCSKSKGLHPLLTIQKNASHGGLTFRPRSYIHLSHCTCLEATDVNWTEHITWFRFWGKKNKETHIFSLMLILLPQHHLLYFCCDAFNSYRCLLTLTLANCKYMCDWNLSWVFHVRFFDSTCNMHGLNKNSALYKVILPLAL